MKQDLTDLFKEWPFDPNRINSRYISGEDGRTKVQLRLDLGIMQIELDGRPDGVRPNGCDSWFDYYQERMEEYERDHGQPEGFVLTAEDCLRVQHEAVQYYHRYLSLFQLGDWQRVIRDTQRNLNAFEFVSAFAENEEMAWMLRQFTPYVIMMNARAKGMLAVGKQDHKTAITQAERGVKRIKKFFQEIGADDMAENSPEIQFLESWRDHLREQVPVSPEEKIQQELHEAIAREEYERAAQLRDQLSGMSPPKQP